MNSFMLSSFMGTPVVKKDPPKPTTGEDTTQKVKISSIPLYPEQEEYDYFVDPPSWMEGLVKDTRIQAGKIKEEHQATLDKIDHVVQTGRAHTNETLAFLRAEENLAARVGAITLGGLVGLVAARRGRFLKKISYISFGLGGVGSVCYPKEAKVLAGDAGNYALKNVRIAYHFVVGTRPIVQNEDGKAFKRMTGMVSDVGQWGFRLFDKEKPSKVDDIVKTTEVVKEDTKEENDIQIVLKEDDAKKEAEIVSEQLDLPENVQEVKKEEDSPKVEISSEQVDLQNDAEAEPTGAAQEIDTSTSTSSTPIESGAQDNIEEKETTKTETNVVPDGASTSSSKQLIIEGDLGQGSLEDKELYTTRD